MWCMWKRKLVAQADETEIEFGGGVMQSPWREVIYLRRATPLKMLKETGLWKNETNIVWFLDLFTVKD